MDKLMEILAALRPDIDFKKEDKLIDGGILDSFDIIALVGELNEAFAVEITVGDLQPENFNSARDMFKLIEDLS